MLADDGLQNRRFAASGGTEKGVSEGKDFDCNEISLKSNYIPLLGYLCPLVIYVIHYIVYFCGLAGMFPLIAKKSLHRLPKPVSQINLTDFTDWKTFSPKNSNDFSGRQTSFIPPLDISFAKRVPFWFSGEEPKWFS